MVPFSPDVVDNGLQQKLNNCPSTRAWSDAGEIHNIDHRGKSRWRSGEHPTSEVRPNCSWEGAGKKQMVMSFWIQRTEGVHRRNQQTPWDEPISCGKSRQDSHPRDKGVPENPLYEPDQIIPRNQRGGLSYNIPSSLWKKLWKKRASTTPPKETILAAHKGRWLHCRENHLQGFRFIRPSRRHGPMAIGRSYTDRGVKRDPQISRTPVAKHRN